MSAPEMGQRVANGAQIGPKAPIGRTLGFCLFATSRAQRSLLIYGNLGRLDVTAPSIKFAVVELLVGAW